MNIKDCAVIISGGASGIGAATARMLSLFGAKVAILDTDMEAGKVLAEKINGIAVQCDISHPEEVENAIQQAAAVHGPARVCISCAGIVKGRRMVSKHGPMPLSEFREVLEVNLVGTFNLMCLAAASMQKLEPVNESQERGVIINTASIAAYEGQIGQTAYSASKGGIVSLTLPAARELAQFGIRVVAIAPGLVDTPMLQRISPDAKQALIANIPFPHRLAKPEEYAKLALHIIDNTMINGEVIRLDGGLRMQAK